VYDRIKKAGFWRTIKVRENYLNELMVTFVVNPKDLNNEKILFLKNDLFKNIISNDIKSIYFQHYEGFSNFSGCKIKNLIKKIRFRFRTFLWRKIFN
jgi:hypothetical protein